MLSGTLPFYPSLPAIESEGPEHEDMPLETISELHATPQDAQVSLVNFKWDITKISSTDEFGWKILFIF